MSDLRLNNSTAYESMHVHTIVQHAAKVLVILQIYMLKYLFLISDQLYKQLKNNRPLLIYVQSLITAAVP